MAKINRKGTGTTHTASNGPVFPPRLVLAPIDGSENATRALQVAIEISKKFGAELFIITVSPRDRTGLRLPGDISAAQKYYDEMDMQSERFLEDATDLASKEGLTNVGSEAIPEFQSVVKQILEQAQNKKADLIVIGTRGLGGFRKLLQGSVSSGVVTHAQCNVLVVR
jgi:nucleotide-binding universal stress UspA family protein